MFHFPNTHILSPSYPTSTAPTAVMISSLFRGANAHLLICGNLNIRTLKQSTLSLAYSSHLSNVIGTINVLN